MDGQPPTECTCGSSNFERVVVRRPNGQTYRTDFIACAECRVMYFDPEPRDPPSAARTSLTPDVDPRAFP
ncbi:MAG: hypothetical protein M3O01_04360 [Pseudomonadota bacterium]|nr:hypothetical protein [Pseudomonadota bacterium]